MDSCKVTDCVHRCTCECHIPGQYALHFKACCIVCPDCKAQIKPRFETAHEVKCHAHTMVDE